uniref:Presenilin n=1 Tax=Parascaris univalens TaxID=6257 RepID=A0A915CHR0_PARUN
MSTSTNEGVLSDDELIALTMDYWTKQLSQVKRLLLPVSLNMALTLIVWIGVYDARTDTNSVFYYMLDSSHNRTTGSDILDGMVNGVGCVFMLAAISFILLTMALYDYKCLVQIWLYFSCVLIIFGVFTSFLIDAFKAFGYNEAPIIPTFILVILYGGLGILAFFMRTAPLLLHQIYVICNCSLVSVFYLRMFPAHTAWFVLICVILWDAFAVLAPIGPLRRINEKAHEYSAQVLRFLMFTAEDPQFIVENPQYSLRKSHLHAKESIESNERRCTINECESDNESNKSVTRTARSSTTDKNLSTENEGLRLRKRITTSDESEISDEESTINAQNDTSKIFTAYDALNDGSSIRLGMGDFVFYSLLVGKAAASGSALCTVGAAIGVLVGLLVTLSLFSKDDETTPALPVSIAFGLTIHFGILLFIEPFLNHLNAHSCLLI